MKQHIEETIKAAQSASANLQAALNKSGAVGAILLLEMIEKARDLENRATVLLNAIEADGGREG